MNLSCESMPVNPLNLSNAAIRGIVGTYRYFGVLYDGTFISCPGEKRYCVVSYRGKLSQLFFPQFAARAVIFTSNPDDAWATVHLLRAARNSQDLTKLLKEVGIT